MLTKLRIRNFKLFRDVEIELGERVVFVGPNNSGKTSALKALALWNAGVRRWVENRGSGQIPKERAGVTLNRRDLIAHRPAGSRLTNPLKLRRKPPGKARARE
jgi:ATPase subunit of ABC transporter with duplicated ATPase domains